MILNDAEQDILDGLDYAYEALYRRAIKRHIDPCTGRVNKISWQSIMDDMRVSPRRGVTQKNLSKPQLRRMVSQLDKLGLIIVTSAEQVLTMTCPLADTIAGTLKVVPGLTIRGVPAVYLNKADIEADTKAVAPKEADTKAGTVCGTVESPQSRAQLDFFWGASEEAVTKAARVCAQAPEKMDDIDINNININININNNILSKFDKFWSVYPRKEKKKRAEQLWARKKLYKIADKIIGDVVNRVADDPRWQNPQYIPLPTSYINDERWEDERQEVIHASTNNQRTRTKADRHAEIFESCLADFKASYSH